MLSFLDLRPQTGNAEGQTALFVQGVISDREHRITELEEALRESIRITAQREVVMHEQQMKLEHTERVVSHFTN